MEHKILNTMERLAALKDISIGNDLVFIPDFKHSLTGLFKNKVYTSGEIAYCDLFDDALLRYASTWAAKEAVYKAVKQLDKAALSWKNIEIVREKAAGCPQAVLHSKKNTAAVTSLTISHDGDYAWAVAIAEIL